MTDILTCLKNNKMKNIPITQRVNSGLFGSKKQNPTAVAKQKVGVTKTTTSTTAGDLITKKGKEKTKTKDFNKEWDIKAAGGLTYEEWIKIPGNQAKEDRFVASQQVGTGEYEPDVVVQGPDKVTETKEFVPTQKRDTNRALAPWEVRMQSRAIKKSGRDMRKSQNRLDTTNRKLLALKEKGITSGRKYDRLVAKRAENTSELDAFKSNMSARQRQARMSASALMADTYKSAQRDSEFGDFTQAKQEQIINSGNYKQNNPSTKRDPNDDPYGFKAMSSSVNDVKTANAMKSEGFFKGKTALKKGYFK